MRKCADWEFFNYTFSSPATSLSRLIEIESGICCLINLAALRLSESIRRMEKACSKKRKNSSGRKELILFDKTKLLSRRVDSMSGKSQIYSELRIAEAFRVLFLSPLMLNVDRGQKPFRCGQAVKTKHFNYEIPFAIGSCPWVLGTFFSTNQLNKNELFSWVCCYRATKTSYRQHISTERRKWLKISRKLQLQLAFKFVHKSFFTLELYCGLCCSFAVNGAHNSISLWLEL